MRGKLRYRLIKAGIPVYVLFFLFLMFFPILLSAQEDDDSPGTGEDPSIESDWYDDLYTDLYVKGDQVFTISLGTVFPAIFGDNKGLIDPKFTPPVGGVGSLSYNYYINSRLFVGGELSGFFIHTLRGNTLFVVPVGARIGTQFIAGRFEFPLIFSLGMTWHTYRDYGYYGFYMKMGAGAYFRPMHDWSFGLTANWGWYPQWAKNRDHSVDGSFVDIMLSARYHF
ncbi:MAG: hypothetical protein FWB73_04075 [Treponema sp.]|nr:hypothetical protein [Treponema sp.]